MRRSVPEGIALVVAVIVIAVSVAVVATRNTSKTSSNTALSSETPAATREPSSSTPAPSSATKGGAAVAPTKAPVTAPAPAAPVHAGAPGPPKPGRYEYTETDSNGTKTSTLDITSHGDGRQTEDQDQGNAVDEVAWRPNGKFELATTFGFSNGSVRCDWNPDFVEYRFPLRVGASWSVQTSCHPNPQSSITLSGTSHVMGRHRVTVGRQSVDTWIVVTDATIRFNGTGASFSEMIRDEDHFAPAYGITVHEVATTTDTDPSGQQTHDKTTRDVKSLAPTTQV